MSFSGMGGLLPLAVKGIYSSLSQCSLSSLIDGVVHTLHSFFGMGDLEQTVLKVGYVLLILKILLVGEIPEITCGTHARGL